MHREYHPEDLHHRRAHAFGGDHDHGHGHDHSDGDRASRGHDHRGLFAFTALLGLLIGVDLLLGWFAPAAYQRPFGLSLTLVAALLGGARIVYGALEALVQGRIGADVALAQACVAAIALGEYFVAAEVVFIAMVGECLEALTADRAFRAIGRLFEQTPRTARVRRDGVEVELPVSQVEPGDLVIVAAGEKIAVDGTVLQGRSTVDQAPLTGESIPVDRGPNEPVFAGTLNQYGRLEVRAERVGHETTLGQVLRLVAEAQHRKAPLQRAADRYARWFLPVVEVAAILTVLAGYALGWSNTWERAVAVLVVACPCALVLATPAAILASMGWLARHGVVIKGGVALERLAACDVLAFDKTGTLTKGRPELAGIVALEGWNEEDVLRLAAAAEASSRHPLAEVVRRAAETSGLNVPETADVQAQPGAGVSAMVRDPAVASARAVLVGNRRLLEEHGITLDEAAASELRDLDEQGATALIVAVDGAVVGLIGARDAIRPEAHDVVHDLKHLGLAELAILTGDRAPAARVVAKKTHIKSVEAELLPADKAAWVRDRQAAGRRVAMVGDGINDAPALAVADVGIALGRVGADLAAEAGDVVLLGEPLHILPDLVRLARRTVAILRQNILGFAFGLNALAMGAAMAGWLGPVAAAILHQAGSLLVLLNSMRLLVFGDWANLPPVRWLRDAGAAIRRLDDRLDPGLALERLWARRRTLLVLISVLTLGLYGAWGWTALGPHEVGLVRRLGRFQEVIGPGLHLRRPPPFEVVTRLEPGRLRGLEVGFRFVPAGPAEGMLRWESEHDRALTARGEDEALLWTGDGRLVELAATVQYRLGRDPASLRRYAFGSARADEALRPLAESAIRAVVATRKLDEILTSSRREVEQAAARRLRERVEACGLGLDVVAVAFQDAHPPLAVVDAYRDVSRAESEAQARSNDGRTYQAEQVQGAEGQAAATRNAAQAHRSVRIARAAGEADAFEARRVARLTAPDLTDQRLYLDTLAEALASRDKLILDPVQAGRRRHLVLPGGPTPPGTPVARQAATLLLDPDAPAPAPEPVPIPPDSR